MTTRALTVDFDNTPPKARQISGLELELREKSIVADEFEKAFNPNQPRHPKGDPKGGQWKDTDGEPQPSGMRRYVDMMAKFPNTGGEWWQKHGRDYQIDEDTFIGGEPQACYKNTFHAVLDNFEDEELTYVEGFISVHGVPIHHAWAVTKDGKVRDYTIGKNSFGGKDPASIVTEYYGVPIKQSAVQRAAVKTKVYGVTAGPYFAEVFKMKPDKVVEGL